jgi:hypothetical protein
LGGLVLVEMTKGMVCRHGHRFEVMPPRPYALAFSLVLSRQISALCAQIDVAAVSEVVRSLPKLLRKTMENEESREVSVKVVK